MSYVKIVDIYGERYQVVLDFVVDFNIGSINGGELIRETNKIIAPLIKEGKERGNAKLVLSFEMGKRWQRFDFPVRWVKVLPWWSKGNSDWSSNVPFCKQVC